MKIPIRLIVTIALFCGFAASDELAHAQVADDLPTNVKIIDTAGKPVLDVEAYWYHQEKVKQLTVSETGLHVPDSRGLIVVHKPGYQYSGTVLGEIETSVVMRRIDEKGDARKTLGTPFESSERDDLLKSLETKFWEGLQDNPGLSTNIRDIRIIESLGLLAPEKLIEFLGRDSDTAPRNQMVDAHFVRVLAKHDLNFAIEHTSEIDDPTTRTQVLLYVLINHASDTEVAAYETHLLDSVKLIKEPVLRLAMLATLAEHFQLTNRPAMSQQIIDRYLPEVKTLPAGGQSGYPRGLFVGLIAEQDPDLAEELTHGVESSNVNGALGRIAFYCCLEHPEKAIELLGRIKPGKLIVGYVSHVQTAWRLAIKHPEMAFQVAESIHEPCQRAWALGLIASRLQNEAPEQSRIALDKAIESLTPNNIDPTGFLLPADALGLLMTIAEVVEPERIELMIWQSVWLVIPHSRWNVGRHSKRSKIQSAAAAIARYDKEIGLALIGDYEIEIGGRQDRAVAIQATVEFNGLNELFQQLEKDTNNIFHYETSIKMLMGSEKDFWDAVSLPPFFKWPTEQFEEF